jgi:hypothetical protein
MNPGWYAILRSGILEHLLAGKLGYPEVGVYATIHLQADFSTGVWVGSAPRLFAAAPRGTSLRQIQRWMRTLVEIGFLRPFHEQGSRGNYPVLIDKYDVKVGALRGMRLNAWKSEFWKKPFYEPCADDDAEGVAEGAPSSVFSSQEAAVAAQAPSSKEVSVWGFLRIKPCGPISFRTLLESRWDSRNGDPYSTLIGETVDAWKAAEGENPRGCASLFRALKELRGSEERNGNDIVRLESWT